ncbi:MAG: S1C family serine protease [Lachnospiraceae bacterium]
MKNRRSDIVKTHHVLKSGEESDEYSFVRETIKSKPVCRRKIAGRVAAFIGGAILFGVIASFVFALLAPEILDQMGTTSESERVKITGGEEVVEEEQLQEDTQPQTDTATESALDTLQSNYQEALSISENARKSLVSVTALSKEASLLDNSYINTGQASGMIIASNGTEYFILVHGAATQDVSTIRVRFVDGTVVNGSVQKSDSATGFTIVKVAYSDVASETREQIEIADLGSSYSLLQGKMVIAIGSPSGYNDTVSYGGITSATNKVSFVDVEYNLLVTDITGSPNASGALLDNNGEVIGIIVQSYGEEGTQNVVKAFPVSQLNSVIEKLCNAEDICYLGINGQDVTKATEESTGIPQGVYIDSVEQDSPAMESGIQSGDIIVKLGGDEVKTMTAYSAKLQKCSKAQKVKIVVMRKGAEGYVEVEYEVTVGAV